MYSTVCLLGKKVFAIPYSDFRYRDIKYNSGKHHLCDKCARNVQDEAQKITGINPDMIDFHDKILRSRSI